MYTSLLVKNSLFCRKTIKSNNKTFKSVDVQRENLFLIARRVKIFRPLEIFWHYKDKLTNSQNCCIKYLCSIAVLSFFFVEIVGFFHLVNFFNRINIASGNQGHHTECLMTRCFKRVIATPISVSVEFMS